MILSVVGVVRRAGRTAAAGSNRRTAATARRGERAEATDHRARYVRLLSIHAVLVAVGLHELVRVLGAQLLLGLVCLAHAG